MVAAIEADESYDLVAHIPLVACDSVRCVGLTTPRWIEWKLLRVDRTEARIVYFWRRVVWSVNRGDKTALNANRDTVLAPAARPRWRQESTRISSSAVRPLALATRCYAAASIVCRRLTSTCGHAATGNPSHSKKDQGRKGLAG
jgi:hypothetical protein